MNAIVYLPLPAPCKCVHCTMRAILLQEELRDPRYGVVSARG